MNMNLDIGAKKPIDGGQVFLVGHFLTSAEPPFVLLYDGVKRRRAKRNIQKIHPIQVVASLGRENFIEIEYPRWGKVWIRTSSVRGVRELSNEELFNSPENIGSLVLFQHDPTPEDEHAGFIFFGMPAKHVTRLLNLEFEDQPQ
jgi:hypothetical protein